ncbi:MAG: UTRA domain-containing protein [Natronohydrobacter sp.]|nr:UTRA domain-containing protein [Natronohydrobacter sp.]
MTEEDRKTWQAVQDEVRRCISQRIWKPGELIPHEAELAQQFGCARATVNRALRGLAEAGLLDRRRKAGTRVTLNPVRRAEFSIPVIREEIEGKGQRYDYKIFLREMRVPPPDVQARLQLSGGISILYLQTLYTADNLPYAFETRWINSNAVPDVLSADFRSLSPNEWLVREVPFDGGDFTVSALTATEKEAGVLGCSQGASLLALDRTTQHDGQIITSVRLAFHPGYRMHTRL